MEEKNIFNDFFSYLSYLGNENDLSDIIAATCNTSFEFKKLFLDFFFPEKNLIAKCPAEIEREVWSDDRTLRFDWYFTTNDNEEYIIENKIYDPNDHFEEYTKVYKEDHIGFIADYNIDAVKYTHKYTWKEFYKNLENNLQFFQEEERQLIKGVLNYIKEVCGIMEKKDFKLNTLNDLGYFIQLFKNQLIDNGFEINNKAKGSSEHRIGFWTYKENRAYWFGLYFDDEGKEGFSIWGGIYDYKMKETKFNNLIFSDYHPEDTSENCNWFKLKNEYLNKLSDESIEYTKKLKILEGFILEIESIK